MDFNKKKLPHISDIRESVFGYVPMMNIRAKFVK